ncbi:MAG: RDD family protein [Myxococcales bacterium]
MAETHPAPLYDAAQVETPEQIELSLPLAGIGSRAIAYLLDLLCQLVPIAALAIPLLLIAPASRLVDKGADGLPELSTLPLAILSLSVFAVNFGYFALFETLWRGQSPGKRWLSLRVAKDGGFPLDGRAALVRNLLRIVDFLPAFYVAGTISIFLGEHGKRIGDWAAGTIVVRERRVRVPAADDAASPGRSRATSGELSPSELALVDGFLGRRHELDSGARDRLARTLATRLAARLGRPSPADAEAFLESLGR